ncbi:MAG: LPS export ABC transporter permease LptG [Gammaproteobacteria bacterium]|nr:LPS export ABC transporter permease LptG [Gammaproteobacteria bacterium]
MRILDLYIGRTILAYTGVSFAVLLGLFTFVNLIDQMGDLGVSNYGMLQVIRYVILTTPRTLYELFPMAALLGAILGLSTLALSSELVVMRASAVPVTRIVVSVLKIGSMLVVLAIVVGEFVTPKSETMAQRGRAQAMQENIQQQTNFGLWLRDHTTYVNVGEVLPDLTLLQVRVFEFDEEGRLRSLVYADEGEFDRDHWKLAGVSQTFVDQRKADIKQIQRAVWRTSVTPQILSIFLIRPDQLSAWRLWQYISHLRENNQETAIYELAFWNKLVIPLSTMVMVILAVPFVFAQVRSGGLGRGLFFGIMLGLGFYAANQGFGNIALVYGLPPFLGATMPLLIFLAAAVWLLRRVR